MTKDVISEKIVIAIADNILYDEPIECTRFIVEELLKNEYELILYTYDKASPKAMANLYDILEKIGVPGFKKFVRDSEVKPMHIRLDTRNFGGFTGFGDFFHFLMISSLVAPTIKNQEIGVDIEFWQTGKLSNGIIKLNQGNVSQGGIILS